MNLDLFDEADPSPPAANPSARDPWCCAATPCRRRRPAAIPGRSDPAVAVPTHGNPGGHLMSVALSNCGRLGWTTDHDGYRYTPADPLSGRPWPTCRRPSPPWDARPPPRPALPASNRTPACSTATSRARACPAPGPQRARFQRAHRVGVAGHAGGVSFRWPGALGPRRPRAAVPRRRGGLGGADRLRFHGVLPLKDRPHPRLGSLRLNLTLRKAG